MAPRIKELQSKKSSRRTIAVDVQGRSLSHSDAVCAYLKEIVHKIDAVDEVTTTHVYLLRCLYVLVITPPRVIWRVYTSHVSKRGCYE